MLDTSFTSMKARDIDFRYIHIGEKVIVPRVANGSSGTRVSGANTGRDHGGYDLDGEASPGVSTQQTTPTIPLSAGLGSQYDDLPESAVAIIGMACRYPEADSLDDFWALVNAGSCVIRQLPEDRFKASELIRQPKGPFWGGYLREPDVFDHRSFGISGREAKSMDPQQRVCLQVAYEAMESSGYCGLRSHEFDREVGCYIGVANDDYNCNVASHPINAFSLTGTLRTYISGRISHFLDGAAHQSHWIRHVQLQPLPSILRAE